MPSHMLPILNCQVTLDIITVCDSILYKVKICSVATSVVPILGFTYTSDTRY